MGQGGGGEGREKSMKCVSKLGGGGGGGEKVVSEGEEVEIF